MRRISSVLSNSKNLDLDEVRNFFWSSNKVAGFTGTRQGMTENQRSSFSAIITYLYPDKLVHGDCIGADKQADEILHGKGVLLVSRPSNIPKAQARGTFATPIDIPRHPLARNRLIVNDSALVIATPAGPEVIRSGTWATIRYTIKSNKPVFIIDPHGSVEVRAFGRVKTIEFSELSPTV